MSPNDPRSDVADRSTPEAPAVRVTSDLPGSVTLAVTGDLDTAGTPVLRAALRAAADADHRQVTVDLCDVTFVGVSALRALLETHADSRARGRALRIVVATTHPLRLLTGVGLEQVTQLRTAPGGGGSASRSRPDVRPHAVSVVRRHLSLLVPAPAEGSPASAAPPSSDPALVLVHWATSWTACEDVPTVAGAVVAQALRSLAAVEQAAVEVLDGPDQEGWWGAAERGGAARGGVGASRSAAVAALTTGARGSILTMRLGAAGAPAVGSLTVSSASLDAFDPDTWREAHFFAALAADVVAGARHRHHMALAIAHRDTIGQAKGMLMERYGLTADRAFAALTRVSSTRNTKLRDVAESLIRTGQL